jgi:hypothetical protein
MRVSILGFRVEEKGCRVGGEVRIRKGVGCWVQGRWRDLGLGMVQGIW